MAHNFFVYFVAVLLELVSPSGAWHEETGFHLMYTSNKAVLKDIPLQFDPPLPSWVNGTLIHNGPGMFEVKKRKFGHLFDGFSKPATWHFDGSGHANFSTDFLKTNSYIESLQMGDIAPYILYMPPSPPFDWLRRMRQMYNGLDNVNINVYRIGGKFVYLSDIWKVYSAQPLAEFSVTPVEPDTPVYSLAKKYALSSSHPLPMNSSDPDGALVNYYVVPMFGGHVIHLCKVISTTRRDFFAQISVGPLPYMHSFGATDNYMILFGHPLYVDSYKMMQTLAPVKSFLWKPQDGSTIYVVNKQSGRIQTFKTDSMVTTHHVNAFETYSGKIVADFVTFPDPSPFTLFTMNNFKNATARNRIRMYRSRIRRFVFDLRNNVMLQIKTPNFNGLANRLDLPVINEKFRYRPYCYVYGITMQSDEEEFSDFRLVKRDFCSGEDLWWGKPGFYPSEPWFVARPGATDEDDGLLFCNILDGKKQLSFLGVFDAKTMEEVSTSYLPTFVPFLLHGRFFSPQ